MSIVGVRTRKPSEVFATMSALHPHDRVVMVPISQLQWEESLYEYNESSEGEETGYTPLKRSGTHTSKPSFSESWSARILEFTKGRPNISVRSTTALVEEDSWADAR